jgi:hypothetical protein
VVEDLSGVTVDDEDIFGVNLRLKKAQKLKLKQQVKREAFEARMQGLC